MNKFTVLPLLILAGVLSVAATTVRADDAMEKLKLFQSGGMQHGKWQVEMLEGTDPSMQQMMQKAGKMSICMDIAKQVAKDYQHDNADANSCTHKIIKDSASSAEVEIECAGGSHVHSILTRDGDKAYIADGTFTSKDNKPRHMKARYTYLGECSGNDGAIQFDKDSPACKMMRAKTQGVDMTAMCARLQDKMREQCEQNIKNLQASCQ